MSQFRLSFISLVTHLLFITTKCFACDLCSIYNSVQSRIPLEGSWHVGVAQQISDMGTIRQRGSKIDNHLHQRLTSSTTQFLLGYDQTDKLSYQLAIPFIHRKFQRVLNDGDIDSGISSGIGDLSLITRYALINKRTDDSIYILQLISGIKLPSGDASRLKEEHDEKHSDMHDDTGHDSHSGLDHASSLIKAHGDIDEDVPSAIHGHDLAIGTGSIDFPIGTTFFAKKGKLFLSGDIQYMIRNKGSYNYRHANDLTWNVGPGYFFKLSKETNIAPRLVLSGSYKANDKNSALQEELGTSLNALYVGPELLISTSYGCGGELGIDLPAYIENSGTQAVVSSRIRAALNFQF